MVSPYIMCPIIPLIEVKSGDFRILSTAFIVEPGIIITAAHAFFDENGDRINSKYGIIISKSFYSLEKLIYEEYVKLGNDYSKNDCIYKDLCVFQIPKGFDTISKLSLSNRYEFNSEVYLMGFQNDDLGLTSMRGIITDRDKAATNIKVAGSEMRYFTNCLRVKSTVSEGFSGGPIMNENEVFGMIVFGETKVGISAIKSEYIIQKLIELKLIED